MLLLATTALAVVIVVVATTTARRRRRVIGARPLVLPVVSAVPRIEEFAIYADYGDRVTLSLAADAPADVVAGAELVAAWYGFGLRVCGTGAAGGTGTDASAAA